MLKSTTIIGEEKQSVYGALERNAHEIADHLKAEIARMCAERCVPISAVSFGIGRILFMDFCGNGTVNLPAVANESFSESETVPAKRKYTRRKFFSCKACKEAGKIFEAPNRAALMRHYRSDHGTNFGRKGK